MISSLRNRRHPPNADSLPEDLKSNDAKLLLLGHERNRAMTTRGIGGLLLSALLLPAAHGQAQFDPGAPSAEPVPGFASVDIDGRSLRYKCVGNGTPTVIIEPGGGVSVETVISWNFTRGWPAIIPAVAKTTRVCAYDRAGLGRSDKATLPRTSRDVAKDLHALLAKANIAPPYVLAGQSFGGMNVRMFTHLYPETVAGVVLVDSSHPDEYAELAKVLPPPQPGDKNYELIKGWREGPDLSGSREWVDLKANAALIRTTGNLGDRPLIVLTQSPQWNDPYAPDDLEPVIDAVGQRLQRGLADLSTRSKFIVASKAGHNIQADEPQLVIDAILDVVQQVRSP
jgi:pimeloyl-ACP methyl ester carboxylesterase